MPIHWDSATVRLGVRGRVRCDLHWNLGAEWSDRLTDFDLWLVWAGKGAMARKHGPLQLRPGVCLWMRPGGRYIAEQDPDDRLGVTWVHFDLLDATGGRIPERELPHEVHEVVDVGYMDAVLTRVTQPSTHAGAAAMLLRGVLMEMEAGTLAAPRDVAAGTPAHHREVVMKAAARMRENPAADLSIHDLANAAGYSTDHFARIFREVIRRSPHDYLVGLRIDRARQMLVESSLTVTQIAQSLGYRDVYFFSRQFKQRTGRSPREFRQRQPVEREDEDAAG